ncbi:hypothetical protein FA95DRAFT_104974 [Auriscalpium vulgare]|uniref:Uncharacterized protein n=1 Tax=Auriscalpium vulgare TaxID=40419 RepID=A0ACB8RPR7_9AGAM|nr:hypothetical protein FA95DRAFT_104974 [Auriscalpium vulgare]
MVSPLKMKATMLMGRNLHARCLRCPRVRRYPQGRRCHQGHLRLTRSRSLVPRPRTMLHYRSTLRRPRRTSPPSDTFWKKAPRGRPHQTSDSSASHILRNPQTPLRTTQAQARAMRCNRSACHRCHRPPTSHSARAHRGSTRPRQTRRQTRRYSRRSHPSRPHRPRVSASAACVRSSASWRAA